MGTKGNATRCPGCGRFGSKELDGYCKKCYAEIKYEEPKQVIEICTKCGKSAFKFLDKSPYHSWYCKEHYQEKLEEFEEARDFIVRDNGKETNPFFKGEFVPKVDEVGMINTKYGYERQ